MYVTVIFGLITSFDDVFVKDSYLLNQERYWDVENELDSTEKHIK